MTKLGYKRVDELLTKLFDNGQAIDLVRAYYKRTIEDEGISVPLFSGVLFDRGLVEGWEDKNPHEITLEDIHGLAYLGLPAAPNFVRDVASGFVSAIAMPFLAEIPTDRTFEEVVAVGDFDDVFGDNSPADKVWGKIRSFSPSREWNIGPTSVSKILACKRPLLIPIYDSKIGNAFGSGTSLHYWEYMHDLFTNRITLCDELGKINTALELDLPLIRTLDVILWMYGQGNRAMKENGDLYTPNESAK